MFNDFPVDYFYERLLIFSLEDSSRQFALLAFKDSDVQNSGIQDVPWSNWIIIFGGGNHISVFLRNLQIGPIWSKIREPIGHLFLLYMLFKQRVKEISFMKIWKWKKRISCLRHWKNDLISLGLIFIFCKLEIIRLYFRDFW